jgi:hypothetical protein
VRAHHWCSNPKRCHVRRGYWFERVGSLHSGHCWRVSVLPLATQNVAVQSRYASPKPGSRAEMSIFTFFGSRASAHEDVNRLTRYNGQLTFFRPYQVISRRGTRQRGNQSRCPRHRRSLSTLDQRCSLANAQMSTLTQESSILEAEVEIKLARATHDFVACEPNELPLQIGDVSFYPCNRRAFLISSYRYWKSGSRELPERSLLHRAHATSTRRDASNGWSLAAKRSTDTTTEDWIRGLVPR